MKLKDVFKSTLDKHTAILAAAQQELEAATAAKVAALAAGDFVRAPTGNVPARERMAILDATVAELKAERAVRVAQRAYSLAADAAGVKRGDADAIARSIPTLRADLANLQDEAERAAAALEAAHVAFDARVARAREAHAAALAAEGTPPVDLPGIYDDGGRPLVGRALVDALDALLSLDGGERFDATIEAFVAQRRELVKDIREGEEAARRREEQRLESMRNYQRMFGTAT